MYNLVVLGCCAAVYFIINLILAHFFKQVAYAKGFDDKCHAWALVFWLGLFGCLYVCALPDLNVRKINADLLDQMKETGELVRRNTLIPTEEQSQQNMEELADKVTDAVIDAKEKVDDIKDKTVQKVNDVKDAVAETKEDIKDTVAEAKETVKESIGDMKDAIKDNISDAKDNIKENLHDVKDNIKEKLGGGEEPMDKAAWAAKSLEMIEEAEKGSADIK